MARGQGWDLQDIGLISLTLIQSLNEEALAQDADFKGLNISPVLQKELPEGQHGAV